MTGFRGSARQATESYEILFDTPWWVVYICIVTQMSKRPNNERRRKRCCESVERLIDPKFFKALGDPNRIAIVARLARCCGSYTVSRVAECCTIDLSVVSRHLVALRDAGIVDVEKRGKEVYYSVRFPEIAKTWSHC